jgi:hypothetical protein
VEPTTPCVTSTPKRTPVFRQPNFSEEEKHNTHPIKEHQLEDLVQEVTINCLHRAEVAIQHNLKWQDMIPLSDYHNFGERHRRNLKNTYSFVRIYGKQRKSQMRIKDSCN